MKGIFALLLLVPFASNADWFGPKTYEDCVISGLTGTTSDVAAQEIKRACRAKFPAVKPKYDVVNADDLKQIVIDETLFKNPDRLVPGSGSFRKDHTIKFHNLSQRKIAYMTLAVLVDDATTPRLYRAYVGAEPRSTDEGFFEFNLSDEEKITSWWIHEIELTPDN